MISLEFGQACRGTAQKGGGSSEIRRPLYRGVTITTWSVVAPT